MHVGKQKTCEQIYIDSWDIEKKKTDSSINLKDVYKGKVSIKTTKKQLYLGDWISSDGSNKENVDARYARAQGVIRDMIFILEGTYFGEFYIKTALILRNAFLVSMLTNNSETWFNLTSKDIKTLESADNQFLRKILFTSSKTSICIMMLELGIIPICST